MEVTFLELRHHNDHLWGLFNLDNARRALGMRGECCTCRGEIGDDDKRGVIFAAMREGGVFRGITISYVCLPCSVETGTRNPTPLALNAVDE